MLALLNARLRRLCALGCAAVLLTACAQMSSTPVPEQIFQDQLFAAPTERPDATAVLAISPSMQHFIDGDFSLINTWKDRRQALVDALYNKRQLRLEYDSAQTRTASQAFDARSGNCLSLVLMTSAFARELGLPVRYRSVFVDPAWSRGNDFYFLSGHVNLTLGEDIRAVRGTNLVADGLTIDFVPADMIRGQRAIEISEATVLAMYMNNRAAENLNDGRLDDAYAFVREALRQDPHFMSAYNTLGVIYRRHGNEDAAERAYRYVLADEPGNTQAMSNLVLVLNDQHRTSEAAVLSAKLKELQPYPPFRYFDLGIAAMKAGEYEKARDWFQKEVARSAYYHEFHFWLALANWGLGDVRQARKQIALAMENSTTLKDHDVYAAKLAWLNSLEKNKQLLLH